MGAETAIEWCHHTFNPWWGCTRVSPGCERCYAEAFAKRTGHKVWGPTAGRREFGPKRWDEVLKWHERAAKAGERRRVFCASMADVFEDHPVAAQYRPLLWDLINVTPFLDWLLLTKRPQNMVAMAPEPWRDGWPRNVWAGTTVEDQKRANERIPHLAQVPAVVRFLSCEPLLEPVDLMKSRDEEGEPILPAAIHWVIVGGESGPGARPFDPEWARDIIGQCRAGGAAMFVKQMGTDRRRWSDPKGGAMDEWPIDLRVRELPTAT